MKNKDAPPNYDYTTGKRNQTRNQRRKTLAQKLGYGIDSLVTKLLDLSDEQLEIIKSMLEQKEPLN